MLEKIQLLKEWIATGQVVPKFRNRNEDDLTTLVNQLEIEAKKIPQADVGGSLPPIIRVGFTQAITGNELWINTKTDEMITVVIKDEKLRQDYYCNHVKVTIQAIDTEGGNDSQCFSLVNDF